MGPKEKQREGGEWGERAGMSFGRLWVQGQGRKNFVRNRTTQAVVLNLGYAFRIFFFLNKC